jgi:hypothetical protein
MGYQTDRRLSPPAPASTTLPVGVLRLLLGLLVWFAIGLQLSIHIQHGYNIVNFFSYFTNLSNLLAATVLIAGGYAGLARKGHPGVNDYIRAVAAVNMAVVGIVFSVLLRNVDLGSLLPWINVLLHYVMPVAVVLDWLVCPSRTVLGVRSLWLFVVFPAVYLLYVLIRGAKTDWYPYPFLDPTHVGGYGGVLLYAVGIAVTFAVVGLMVLALGRRR